MSSQWGRRRVLRDFLWLNYEKKKKNKDLNFDKNFGGEFVLNELSKFKFSEIIKILNQLKSLRYKNSK